MRTLAFRVWNSGINAMFEVYGFNERSIQYRRENGELGTFSYAGNSRKKLHLMQYTGLNDKNGKEIYEGDRIKQRTDNFTDGGFIDVIYEVRWAKWCHCLYIHDKYCGPLDTPKANSVEVVGNIYEQKLL